MAKRKKNGVAKKATPKKRKAKTREIPDPMGR